MDVIELRADLHNRIDKDKITLDWIIRVSRENRNTDKILVEKVIRELLLVEGVVKNKLPFVLNAEHQ